MTLKNFLIKNGLVLASTNSGKLRELRKMLPADFELFGLADFSDINFQVDEDQNTFAGNAEKKARTLYDFVKKPVLADDSGLEVDALNGEPGVYSARFGGEGLSDYDRCHLLLEKMKDIDQVELRTARFRSVLALYYGQEVQFFEGSCEGYIDFNLSGNSGFGYDPVFVYTGNTITENERNDRTFADMTAEEKNAVSHRANALKKLIAALV